MKSVKFVVILLLVLSVCVRAEHREIKMGPGFRPAIQLNEDISIYVRHERVYIVSEWDHEDRVVITRNHDLIVDGDLIHLNREQTKFVEDYYDLTTDVMYKTKEIAREGARIGLQGAGIGLKAVASVCKLILPSYDSDDLERDMERESAKIEAKADILEAKGEEIDDMFDELGILHQEMKYVIPELRDLDWF